MTLFEQPTINILELLLVISPIVVVVLFGPFIVEWFRHRRHINTTRRDFAEKMDGLDAAFARQKRERQEQMATWDDDL